MVFLEKGTLLSLRPEPMYTCSSRLSLSDLLHDILFMGYFRSEAPLWTFTHPHLHPVRDVFSTTASIDPHHSNSKHRILHNIYPLCNVIVEIKSKDLSKNWRSNLLILNMLLIFFRKCLRKQSTKMKKHYLISKMLKWFQDLLNVDKYHNRILDKLIQVYVEARWSVRVSESIS